MYAVWGCLLVLFADLFDRFERRFAVDLNEWDELPKRALAWGVGGGYYGRGFWYFMLRLPSWSFEFAPQWDDYRWGRRVLLYTTRPDWVGRKWRVTMVFG